jgi:hypothetical protein
MRHRPDDRDRLAQLPAVGEYDGRKIGRKVLPRRRFSEHHWLALLRDCKVPQAIKKPEMIKTSDQNWYYRLLKAIEQNL